MNNIDRNKLIKMLATLAAICLIVGSIAKLAGANSMTLTEYIEKNESTAVPQSDEENQDTHSSTSASEAEILHSEENPDENSADSVVSSSLIGASLNGDSQKDQRNTYKDSFYYEPLSDNLKRYITGVSFPVQKQSSDLAVGYDNLYYVHIMHYDFDGNLAEGELICNKTIAQDLIEIFYELYRNEYQLEKVRLIDEYDGDDVASMEDNNTSCFNYREVAGSASLSKHALGLAVDINPLYNPYITYGKDGSEIVSPAAALSYADRDVSFPYKINEDDLACKLFKEHGFTWGGNWNSCKDYQHFQKAPAP